MVDLASLWSKFLSFLLVVVVTIVPAGLRRDIDELRKSVPGFENISIVKTGRVN